MLKNIINISIQNIKFHNLIVSGTKSEGIKIIYMFTHTYLHMTLFNTMQNDIKDVFNNMRKYVMQY